MRRWLPILLVLLLTLVGVWFWFLGALPNEASLVAAVTEIEGGVTVRSADGSIERAAIGLALKEGDVVTTDASGRVTLDWFREGETGLGPSSELLVRAIASPDAGPLAIRLRLESGRAWTRVLRLLELDADVSVETPDVVATVRGTSFGIETRPGQGTSISVGDSVVEASGASIIGYTDGFFVPEGTTADISPNAGAGGARIVSNANRDDAWLKENRAADERFRKVAFSRMRAALAAEGTVSDGAIPTLREWSERLRVRFSFGAPRERLEERYALRRLLLIRLLAENGKSGRAYQELARMEGELKTRRVMVMAERLFQDVDLSSPAYRIKQRVEALAIEGAMDPADRLHGRLMTIDARLDEASRELAGGNEDGASQVLVLARQGLANVDRERREAKGVDANRAGRLQKIWKALSIRADALDARLRALDLPAGPSPVIPTLPSASSTSAIPPVASTSTPVAATSTPSVVIPLPVSLTLTPGDQTIGFNERVTYRAIVVYDDGTTRDVTKSSRFTMSPTGYGALNGNVFSATVLQGSITVYASYGEQGTNLTAASGLTIVQR